MNHFFNRLPLPVKLILMAFIPLALLIYFASQIYKVKTEKIQILDNYLERFEQSAQISNLVDALVSERRYSFGYVINGNWKEELQLQRPGTDQALQQIEANPQMANLGSYTFLDSLPAIRERIDQKATDPAAVMSYYTNVIFRLNTLNVISAGNISFLEPVKGELAGQKLLSEITTYLGILRANIYYGLHENQTAAQMAASSAGLYEILKSYEREFLLKGSPEATTRYTNIRKTNDQRLLTDFIENLVHTQQVANTFDAESWWEASANAVDEIRVLQRSQLIKAQQGVVQIHGHEVRSRNRTLVFLLASIGLVVLLVAYTIITITRTLNQLNQAANAIATGATGIPVTITSDDVVGSLAASIRRVDQNNQALSTAAEAIGKGDFSVPVTPRSKDDILGNAVLNMKRDLAQFTHENQEKLWIHTGISKVNESIRGEKDTATLAKETLNVVTEYIGGAVGLLYISNDHSLDFAASYAVADKKMVPQKLEVGETLLGQVAQQKQPMVLNNLPDDFIKVKTAAGTAAPRNVVLYPLVQNDILEGVVEIGSLDTLAPGTLEFLQQVSPAIAIALQRAKSNARLKELFRQTQAQSEELKAQHGELENINAELEAQTEKLQASEEELRVQQEELLQANQELEERSRLLEERNQLIAERNVEIQRKAEELALSTKYKSEFLANMSHELRTPLNSVLLLSRLLAENNDKNLTPDQIEYANVILGSGQGLLLLIDEILDLSKIEAGKMVLEFQPVALEEIVQDLRLLFTQVARERNLELQFQMGEKLPAIIETDKMRLEQVLKNLLSNALKFTSKGSVSLTVQLLRDQPSFISFSVKDTGIGIAPEKQAIIFEAFQQADGSTRRKYGGTGLGLSISRELTKLLGGEIKLTSEEGKGSEFTIYIPISKTTSPLKPPSLPLAEEKAAAKKQEATVKKTEEALPAAVPDDRNTIATNDKSILIIEDDTAFAKALLDFARKKGYKGLVAVRGDEGIQLAHQYKPSGILLDIQLPVKDGWQVMEDLKGDAGTRHIPVHVMSSLEAKKESMMRGAVDFINKPVAFEQMQEVFRKIEDVLQNKTKKVLIVEENMHHAKALGYYLENFNVKTEITSSINGGVEALKQGDVNCVILDMGIPDQHAYETLEAAKKNANLADLPIIIFTGKSLSKSEELRIKQFADSIVIKTAHSYERILDEVSLFLHLVEKNAQDTQPSGKYKRLGALNEVLENKKVLVTDDDVRNIFSLTRALEMYNMKVVTAVDGKEALLRLEENPDVDVVLMDMMMPEMDGYEAMQKIRQKAQFRTLPIIAVTAKAMTGDREKCIKAGASDYVSKPVDVDQLLSLLRVWLYDKRS